MELFIFGVYLMVIIVVAPFIFVYNLLLTIVNKIKKG